MSKQSEAKEKQGYVAKAIPQTCAHCHHLEQTFYHYELYGGRIEGKNPDPSKYAATYSDNLRCGIGEFAVKKSGACNEFAGKE